MRFSSLHTHTVYCDGADDIETMCAAAYDKNLYAIGFSAHAPLYSALFANTEWHLKPENLAAYFDDIRAAKKRWAGKIKVLAGLEADYIAGVTSPAAIKAACGANLDYLIGSVHYLTPPRGKPFTVDGPAEEFETGVREGYGGDAEAAVNAYWDAVEALIREGGFDILGHVDIIKKNNGSDRYFSQQAAWYQERAARIADSAAQYGVLAEVNTGGLNRKKTTELYPSPFFLKLLNQKNVPVIITADAHCAEHLNGYYTEAAAALKDAGYTVHTLEPSGEKEFL